MLSCVWLFPTPWTVACQAPLSMGDSPGRNTGVGCHVLLQGFFLTQESNQDLLHCRRILYQLSCQGSHIKNTNDYLGGVSTGRPGEVVISIRKSPAPLCLGWFSQRHSPVHSFFPTILRISSGYILLCLFSACYTQLLSGSMSRSLLAAIKHFL